NAFEAGPRPATSTATRPHRDGSGSVAVGGDDLAAGPGPQRPPGAHRDGALDEADAAVGQHAVAAAGVVAGCVLILAECDSAVPAVEPAAAPGVLGRTRRDDRVERRVAVGADGPSVTLVVVGGELTVLEVLVAEQQVVHDSFDVAVGIEHLGRGAARV